MSKEVFCVLPLMVQVLIHIRYTSSHCWIVQSLYHTNVVDSFAYQLDR
jgi:hypothetical protein